MSGNGTDLGHIVAMFQQIMVTLAEHGRVLADHGRVLAAHSERFDRLEATMKRFQSELKAEISDLRATVNTYHGSVIGHGVPISEHDRRLGRVEDHLSLPPLRDG